jgi:hypothetical protein
MQKKQQKRGGHRSAKQSKYRLRGILRQVWFGHYRKAIKIFKTKDLGSPIHLLAYFGQTFERTYFRKTHLVPKL